MLFARHFDIPCIEPPEAVILRLTAHTRTPSLATLQGSKAFVGAVTPPTFSLRSDTTSYRFICPVLEGHVEPRTGGALMRVRCRPFVGGYVLMAITALMGLWILTGALRGNGAPDASTVVAALTFPLVIAGFVWGDVRFSAGDMRDRLYAAVTPSDEELRARSGWSFS